MPTISMFYGINVQIFFKDNDGHFKSHIDIRYQEELLADWDLASKGEQPFKIEPLR